MKVGNLVKFKGPPSLYRWRPGYSGGIGMVIEAAHFTGRTMRGCSILWSDKLEVDDIPEDWLEVVK